MGTPDTPTHPPGNPAAASSPVLKKRWPRWTLLTVLVLALVAWFARAAIIGKVEREVTARLAQNGIYLRYGARTWSLWRGLRLENVVLLHDARGRDPVVEISALTIGLPFGETLRTRRVVSLWRTDDATLTLHDPTGAIAFDHITARLVWRDGSIEVNRLEARHGALAVATTGHLALPPDETPAAPAGPFALDLATVRDVLTILAFPPAGQTFTIRGTWSVEVRNHQDPLWQADVTGHGDDVTWQSIPLRRADLHAMLAGATGLQLTSTLQFTAGSAGISAARTDWEKSPLTFSGKLTDAAGAVDEIAGAYDAPGKSLTVSRLAGPADLAAFARNFPALTSLIPTFLQIQKFPDLAVTDFSYSFAPSPVAAWQLGSLELRSPSQFAIVIGAEPLRIELAEGGRASFTDKTWKTDLNVGPSTWRDFNILGAHLDATATGPHLKSTVAVQLPHGSADFTVTTDDYLHAPLEIAGALQDTRGQSDRFAASYRYETAAWRIAHLSGKADLFEFAANFPGLPTRPPEGTKLRSFPEISVSDIASRPGQSPTIGAFRLVSPADLTVPVRGHPVEIDHLTGQVAFDGRSWKISHLAGRVFDGQVTMDGVYEGQTLRDATIAMSDLHVAQLKPWLGESQASLGEAILAVDYRGAISTDPSQITGTGQARLANAPIVKIPLLDQTYALFSVLSSPVQRRGNGSLDASFSATQGLVTVSSFTARSDAARVTATGTVDLKKREVTARARGNIRGLFGLATTPLSRALEMQVSGPFDNLRVRPVGFVGLVTGTLTGTAEILPGALKKSSKFTGDLVRDGIALPLKALDLVTPGPPEPKSPK